MGSKIQADLAWCLSTTPWVEFCGLVRKGGLEGIGDTASIHARCLARADKIELCMDA